MDQYQDNASSNGQTHLKSPFQGDKQGSSKPQFPSSIDPEFCQWLDKASLEALVEFKLSRFFDQLDSHYPDDLYTLIISKVEKTLLHQILRRTGYNQAQASKILGINRNTLRKKMTQYDLG